MKEEEYRQHRFARPAGATEILLVRHGESRAATASNPFPLVDGHGDPELHPEGVEQARRLGARLAGLPIAAVYVTTLRRTRETAAPLCAARGLVPLVEADLREVHLGEWEGGTYRVRVRENHPAFRRAMAEERWDAIPGGESNAALEARVLGALRRIAARHPDALVAAFTHGGVIGRILASATGSRPFAFNGADNGSISHVVVDGERIVVRRFNDVSHLTDEVSAAPQAMT